MSCGRPFEPGNKFGRGRPPGNRNKRTLMAQKLLEHHSGALMGLAIVKAREDRQMLRMLISLLVPRRKESPIKIGSLAMSSIEDLDRSSAVITEKALAGKMTFREAEEVSNLIEARRRVIETRDLARRVTMLEDSKGLSDPNVNQFKRTSE